GGGGFGIDLLEAELVGGGEVVDAPVEDAAAHVGGDVGVAVDGAAPEHLGIGLEQVRRVHLERVPMLLHVGEAALANDVGDLVIGERSDVEEGGDAADD